MKVIKLLAVLLVIGLVQLIQADDDGEWTSVISSSTRQPIPFNSLF